MLQMLHGQKPSKLMDVKGLDKLDLFRGDPEKWRLWSYQMRSFCGGVSISLVALMRTAQQSTTGLIANDDEEKHMSAQLHLILVGVLREKPLNTVMDASDSHGLAWRRLTKHNEPATASRFRGLLRALLNPMRPTNEGSIQSLEIWWTQVAMYESLSKDVLGDHIRTGIVAPPELQTHLNAEKLATHLEGRKSMVGYIRKKSTLNRVVPVEVNWLDKGLKGKGKGKKGKGGKNDQGK